MVTQDDEIFKDFNTALRTHETVKATIEDLTEEQASELACDFVEGAIKLESKERQKILRPFLVRLRQQASGVEATNRRSPRERKESERFCALLFIGKEPFLDEIVELCWNRDLRSSRNLAHTAYAWYRRNALRGEVKNTEIKVQLFLRYL